MRRVVVTGMGIVSPLGLGLDHNWQRLTNSESGIRALDAEIDGFKIDDLPCQIAGVVPKGKAEDNHFDTNEWIEVKEQRKMDRFIHLAICAGQMAINDSGWQNKNDEDSWRTGTLIGAGIGGLKGITDGAVTVDHQGARRLTPFYIPANLINLASGYLSIRHNLKGPNHAVVTACASGTHAIGDAYRMIALGDADRMLCGGAEAAVIRMGMAGFCSARALSTSYNGTPQQASRPWDDGRDGFVMGEGAGILFLEELECALKRDAHIYGEIVGYGMSGDANHVTAPAPDGNGAYRAMQAALKSSKLNVEDINYINAHGTSTPLGDAIEVMAVKNLFGDHAYKLLMSSTKSSIGHLLGAAGAVEAIYAMLAMKHNIAPPTLNLDNPSEGCDLDFVAHYAKEHKINTVMSNSFGFGGTNSSIIIKSYA